MYFSTTIFSLLNFSSPTLTSLSIALTNFLCTLIALLIIDHVGRRRIILCSVPVMTLALLTCSIAYEMLGRPSLRTSSPASNPSSSPNTNNPPTRSPYAIPILLSLLLYVSAYAIGIGNIAWQQSELFPLSVRSLGSGIATATNWGSNFLVGLTFLPMMQYLTPQWTFAVYAAVCAGGWVCCWGIYPETRGLGLEDVRGILARGYGVRESLGRGKVGMGVGL